MRSKIGDYLYVIFIGLLLFLAGSIIIGGASFLLKAYVGIDLISVILYYIVTIYITKEILKHIDIRNLFVSIYLPILAGLMYIFSEYVAFVIIYTVNGAPILQVLGVIPRIMYYNFLSYFTSFSLSVDGIFGPILNIFYLIIEILVVTVGVYQSYKITRRL